MVTQLFSPMGIARVLIFETPEHCCGNIYDMVNVNLQRGEGKGRFSSPNEEDYRRYFEITVLGHRINKGDARLR